MARQCERRTATREGSHVREFQRPADTIRRTQARRSDRGGARGHGGPEELDDQRTVGEVVRTERRRHGLHFRRNHDDKVFSDTILLELPDGELTTVTMDEFTVDPASLNRRPITRNSDLTAWLDLLSRTTNDPRNLFTIHPRSFDENRYVYPVVSRRAGGISIGVNLNLDKVCNFDCVYCQVDRTEMGEREFVELAAAGRRAGTTPSSWSPRAGSFEGPRFSHVPERAAAAQRHRPERRRRADHLPQLRRGGGRLRRGPPASRARRREAGADHQRQHVPPPARPARAGNARRQQRRDLGQARRRHRRLLQPRRPHRRSASPRFSTTFAGPPGSARSSSSRCSCGSTAKAPRGRTGRLLRPARRDRPPAAGSSSCRFTPSPGRRRRLTWRRCRMNGSKRSPSWCGAGRGLRWRPTERSHGSHGGERKRPERPAESPQDRLATSCRAPGRSRGCFGSSALPFGLTSSLATARHRHADINSSRTSSRASPRVNQTAG